MKFWWIIICIGFLNIALAQEEIIEEEDETIPTNWFMKVSLGLNTINSTEGTLDFQFWDDGFPTDSIATVQSLDNLWAYGAALDFTYLMQGNFTLNINNFFGGGGGMINYIGQLGVGYEYLAGSFVFQPNLSVGFIYSAYNIGTYFPSSKSVFNVNNTSTFDLRTKLVSNAFLLSPSIYVEYPMKKRPNIAFFAKASVFYTFGRYSYVSFSGETEFVDEDGDPIRENFSQQLNDNSLEVSINGTPIVDRKTPNLNYNFNSLLIQVGVSFRISNSIYDDDF